MRKFVFPLITLCIGFSCFAQDKLNIDTTKKKNNTKWDISSPPGTFKEVEFTVSEGTWLNLDVSPDGREIVFDMLGDIYIMPIAGGEAKLLRGGHAFEVQPRFSPDGKKISFTSDMGGGDNIWFMNRDGLDAKQVTKEDFRLLNNAVWTPDGNYLIVRKHFTSRRSLGAGELWIYHLTGGDGIQLTKRKNDQQDLGEPSVSPDGRYVYYSEDMYPGGYFQYNKDPNDQIYVINRYDRENGETATVTGGTGGACRPQVSGDGKTLAFVRRVREKTVLYLRNLITGEEWPVFDKLSKDQQEAWAIFGVYPNFNWLDSKNIILWSEGKILKIDITTSQASEIPFTATCKHRIYDALKFPQEPAPEKFIAKTIRHAVTSPDEKMIVFNAAGYLWKKILPDGIPQRLTNGTDFEFEPAFSPDGTELVYITWNDEITGAIMKINLNDKKVTKLTAVKGIYRNPRFSSDGRRIVYEKDGGNDHLGFAFCVDPGIYIMDAAGGNEKFIIKDGSQPSFSSDGRRIFFHSSEGSGEEQKHALKSCDLNGKDVRVHFTSKYANVFVSSPDNNWVAYRELYKVYVAAMPATGRTVDLSSGTKAVPLAQVARDEGLNIHWSADSKKVHWTIGDEYFASLLKDRFKFLPGAPDSIPPMDTAGVNINLVLVSGKPKGIIALKGARIITMKGDEVIENGTIIVNENRITDIGKAEMVKIPEGTKIIDVSGKTVMPGFIDVHAHLGTFRNGLSPQKQWSYYANLAYGVTTTHDPSSTNEMVFSQSEMVKAGNMVGPRIFSTGTILYGADGDFKAVINSLNDALSSVRRTKAYGAFSVKSYNQPRREQRQQVIEAARQLGIMVYPEGGSTTWYNLTHILDGHTGVEHNLPYAPLYDDVVNLWSNSKTGYTPTLIVCYGAISGEYYWYQKTNVWENERLLKYMPRFVIDQRARHRTMIPDKEYENGYILVSKSCKKLSDAGVKVNVGGHGQLQGLGVHWELWMLAQGGMSAMQALRCATVNGAEYIGMDKDLGSLEKGKLADLIVLDKNPLDDIRNTEWVRYTMVNGRLYDCETMNEIGNYDRKRSKFYWEIPGYGNNFLWHEGAIGDEE
ncbi:MAG: PD40 domain-containing protein [Bacteroidetes bacterium]|nr:PD40 domain-containing protein [Bacteroidota bacterium]